MFKPRWRCRKASDALLHRSMASSGSISPFSFISFPIQLPVRKVKSGKLWWTVPLQDNITSGQRKWVSFTAASRRHSNQTLPSHLMVIIFLWITAESSFLMRLMFPAHWNFSELMKKIGCLTLAKISSSKGNIQASSATPHLRGSSVSEGVFVKHKENGRDLNTQREDVNTEQIFILLLSDVLCWLQQP